MQNRAMRFVHYAVGLGLSVYWAARRPTRDQRGLSQSTEYVILLGGAVVVAGVVIALVRNYIEAHPIPEP